MNIQNRLTNRIRLLNLIPVSARSHIRGVGSYANIRGYMEFRQLPRSVLVSVYVENLPFKRGTCSGEIFAFHIHSGTSCTGTPSDPLKNVGEHLNPQNCKHPYHMGDMPPLFGNNGEAFMTFETNRFTVREVIGRVVIIHRNPDDFNTQPSGNAGEKIACGRIVR